MRQSATCGAMRKNAIRDAKRKAQSATEIEAVFLEQPLYSLASLSFVLFPAMASGI